MSLRTFTFDCRGDALVGVLHEAPRRDVGVIIIVGGPQYRAGSHRQFVHLARDLAAAGFPTLRFDTRGMGDSEGEFPGFEHIGPDLGAAVDAMFEQLVDLKQVVLWGLCDAASAAMMYAWRDERVAAMALANPWVRSESGEARTLIRHYYLQRVLSGAFWRDVFGGRYRPLASLRSFLGNLMAARGGGDGPADDQDGPYQQRMRDGLTRFDGPVLLIISGNDLTAAEFDDAARDDPVWQASLGRDTTTRVDYPGANHTFSSAAARAHVGRVTLDWLSALPVASGDSG